MARPQQTLLRSRACPSRGGAPRSSTRSTRARSPTANGDGVGDLDGIRARASTTSPGSASTRSGSRRSSARRWPTSATTSPTTATSIRCSARSPSSTGCSPTRTRAASACCSTGCRTTPPTGIPGSSSRAASRTSPKRDWYVWRDPAPGGGPPNNWMAAFGDRPPAWTLDPATGQYYLHHFLPAAARPRLANPEVEAAMHDVLRFWLDRGVDGFRIDVVHGLGKDPALPDDPPDASRACRTAALNDHAVDPSDAPRAPSPGRRLPRRPRAGGRGLPARLDARTRSTTARATSCTWPSTSGRRADAVGRGGVARADRGSRRRRSTRSARGRRGCSRTTTRPATAPASAPRRARARPRCCSSRCAARRSSTPARSSASRTPSSRPSRASIRAVATAAARRSRGTRGARPRLAGAHAVAALAARAGARGTRARSAPTRRSILHLYRRLARRSPRLAGAPAGHVHAARRARGRRRVRARAGRRPPDGAGQFHVRTPAVRGAGCHRFDQRRRRWRPTLHGRPRTRRGGDPPSLTGPAALAPPYPFLYN